jgi:hypothetical protein
MAAHQSIKLLPRAAETPSSNQVMGRHVAVSYACLTMTKNMYYIVVLCSMSCHFDFSGRICKFVTVKKSTTHVLKIKQCK